MTTSSISFFANTVINKKEISLEERLTSLLQAHAQGRVPDELKVDEVHAFNGMSGYNYWQGDDLRAQVYLASLVSGTYVIYSRTNINDKITEAYDYYDMQGNLFYTSATLDGQCVTYSSIAMDPSNPFTNHIYNILNVEYTGMNQNFGDTGRVHFYQGMIRRFKNHKSFEISTNAYLKDAALLNIKKEILKIEGDTILRWGERQAIFKRLKEVRQKILSTKRRAHGYNIFTYDFAVMCTNISLGAERLKMRPINNIAGTLYNNTFGRILWFFDQVKKNIGLSIAMAIYAPFTFYFITQPLNPKAMMVVDTVRDAYINTVDFVMPDEEEMNMAIVPEVVTESTKQTQDSATSDKVSTKNSAIKKETTQAPTQSWDSRMSDLKKMHMVYESNMMIAPRIGRIETFENQYNFAMTAEAAWNQMSAYLQDIDGTLNFTGNKDLDKRYVSFLKNEKTRTLELKVYIWKKMSQFFLDHPYQIVDQENEQTAKSYYTGRQFIFYTKITKELQAMKLVGNAVTHENIQALAKKYANDKKLGRTIIDTLKLNSNVFKQRDYLSSDDLRRTMKRHWEKLYIQQTKRQEAASFALQSYTWSIRNAMWILQSIYSKKLMDLRDLTQKAKFNGKGIKQGLGTDKYNDDYLASMFNNMTSEYVSIKKEIVKALPNDNEVELRESVIENIKNYLTERDNLFNSSVKIAKK